MFRIEEIETTLAKHKPDPTQFEANRNCAAVAMILAGDEPDLKLCMIRRAEKSGVPWWAFFCRGCGPAGHG
jgi:hypothetical protein